MYSKLLKQINKTIIDNKEKYIHELVKFCAQPSISIGGRGMDEMFNLVKDKLELLGANVQSVRFKNGYPIILAEIKAKTNSKKKPTVLIYNHYDVQPEDPLDKWDTPPFEPTIKGGKVYARGVSDNKANLLFRLQVIESILNTYNDLPVNLKWIIEGEEEVGSPSLEQLSVEYGHFWKDANVCIWETGGVTDTGAAELSLGLKGITYIELECTYNKSDLHSGNAAVVGSPVWRLIKALGTLRDVDGNVTVDGLYQHAIKPSKYELDLIKNTNFDSNTFLKDLGAQKSIVDVKDKIAFQHQMYYKCTANICGIWGGYTVENGIKTIIPNKATAKMDFRLVKGITVKDALTKIRKHLDKNGYQDIVLRELISEEAAKTDAGNIYVKKCIKVLKQVYKKDPLVVPTSLGSGPMFYVSDVFNIPTVHIGAENPKSKPHAPNENIRISDYFKAMEAFTTYLFEI